VLSWVLGIVGTFTLSLALACGFLLLRCRGVGPPFGPHARPWALLIVVLTAMVSTGVGLFLVAVSHRIPAVYAGVVVVAGLWFTRVPPRRDRDMLARTLASWPTLPFSRLYDGMGDDMQDAQEDTLRVAQAKPQWTADAAKYFYDRIQAELKDNRALADLERWQASIAHKINVVGLISLDTTPAELQAALQMHASTENIRKYSAKDLKRLVARLESDALNELSLLLAYMYRLGYYKLPPFTPPVSRNTRHAPSVRTVRIGDHHR
jgi:hypothetical protein